MKIREYLALMTFSILVPVIIFSGIALNTLLGAEREAVLRGNRETVRASVLRVDRELSNAETALRVLATSENIAKENWAEFYRQAKAANESGDVWVVLADENGQQLVNTLVPFGTALPNSGKTRHIQNIFYHESPQVSNLILGPMANEYVIAVGTPVILDNGKRYVINQIFRAAYFNRLLSSPETSSRVIFGIYDREGRTIARNQRPGMFVGKYPKPDLLQAMLQNTEGVLRNKSRDDTDVYSLFARSHKSGWTCTLSVPAEEVDAAARHAVRLTAFGLLAVLLSTTAAAFFFGRRLIRSISGAVDSAIVLGKGDTPTTVPSGIKEVDRLQLALSQAGVILRHAESERAQLLLSETAARNQAEAQNAAKDQFLAMLGHELRNPLAPISAAAELLKIARPDDARVSQASDIIARQTSHLTDLVDDLLDVSRVTRGLITLDRHVLDMKRAVHDAVEQVRPLMEARRHHLRVHLPSEPVFILGDQKRIVQIIANLLNNAAKYTPEGGNIVIRVEAQEQHVMLAIADDGIGMAPELMGRVFELFAQAERTSDRAQGGLGLGLALVKSLVELHGGSVSVQSKGIGAGSELTVCLPRITPLSEPLSTAHDNPGPASGKALRLMVVDDNVDAARMLAMFLEAIGHRVIVEHQSKRALERARIERPDVCLLDIGLPDMDGNELARRLRSQPETAEAVLVAITGYGQPHDRENAIKAGFDFHFIKPVDTDKLSSLLAGLLKPAE